MSNGGSSRHAMRGAICDTALDCKLNGDCIHPHPSGFPHGIGRCRCAFILRPISGLTTQHCRHHREMPSILRVSCGICSCDPAWSGSDDCAVLAFEPMPRGPGKTPGYYNATEASWGGNVVKVLQIS